MDDIFDFIDNGEELDSSIKRQIIEYLGIKNIRCYKWISVNTVEFNIAWSRFEISKNKDGFNANIITISKIGEKKETFINNQDFNEFCLEIDKFIEEIEIEINRLYNKFIDKLEENDDSIIKICIIE